MMSDAASSPQIGAAISASLAGSLIEWIGFPPPVMALAMAAAGLGMIHAQKMGRAQAIFTWICSSLVSAGAGSGLASLIAMWLNHPQPSPAFTGLLVIVSGIATHPAIRWIGKKFPAIADASLRRVGIETEEAGK